MTESKCPQFRTILHPFPKKHPSTGLHFHTHSNIRFAFIKSHTQHQGQGPKCRHCGRLTKSRGGGSPTRTTATGGTHAIVRGDEVRGSTSRNIPCSMTVRRCLARIPVQGILTRLGMFGRVGSGPVVGIFGRGGIRRREGMGRGRIRGQGRIVDRGRRQGEMRHRRRKTRTHHQRETRGGNKGGKKRLGKQSESASAIGEAGGKQRRVAADQR